jgi:Fur family transcriptional regulator, peroxide stress response regulator
MLGVTRKERQMQPEVVAKRLEEFRSLCRTRGIPLTHQRLAIYQALLETDSHPSAETVFRALHDRLPQLSLGTVYKNLEILQELGLISEVNVLHETARYDANLEAHHHLVCVRCKRVIDLYDDSLARVAPRNNHGFVVTDVRVQVNGVCPDCRGN